LKIWAIGLPLALLIAAGCSGGGQDETPKVQGKVEVIQAPAGPTREEKMAASRERAMKGRTQDEPTAAIGDGR
jgi:hypothetical protein